MSKKSIMRGTMTGIMAMSLFGGLLTNQVQATASNSPEDTNNVATIGNDDGIAPCNDLVWVVKEENGKKYRRLYDATRKVWLTDWILCD